MAVRLYFSNSIESLAKQFANDILIVQGWPDPIEVLVPNPYLMKWLQLETARINGISMNLRFLTLNEGLWKLLDTGCKVIHPTNHPAQSDIRLFLCHALKKITPHSKDTDPLSRYLFDIDGTPKSDYEQRLWTLSGRLARYFQDYEVYRADLIDAWMKGNLLYATPMETAQRHLYLSLFGDNGVCTSSGRAIMTLPQYWRHFQNANGACSGERIFIFGETRLSPLHAAMIYELGKTNEINIYQVNPCNEFWEDVTTPGEDRWRRIRSLSIDSTDEGETLSLHENDNPLLKFWGKTGRETIKILSLLEEAGSKDCNLVTEWIDPEPRYGHSNCLALLQRQIRDRISESDEIDKIPQDTSIQIASCPDLYREVEAVYNSIIYNLVHDDDLLTTDIAVMVPDMSTYGPVIEAVFSREPRRVTFSMIDTTAVTDSIFGSGLRAILSIASGDFSRKDLFELFYNQCFLHALSLTSHDVDVWLSWTDHLHIYRRFMNSDSKYQENNLYTWLQGLRRLRLGRIMSPIAPVGDDFAFSDFLGIVPHADFHTGDRDNLEAFIVTIELLHAKTTSLKEHRASGAEWLSLLSDLCDEFLSTPPSLHEEAIARSSLMKSLERITLLDEISQEGEVGLSLAFLRACIEENLSTIPSSRGRYLTGGINISAMIPNRPIPFALIYILGMQEGIFPGNADGSTLNLMTRKRKLGDATRPDLNRYLFLETLLSTRKKLYITYVSRELRKDQVFHPNSTISQLLNYLNNHVLSRPFFIPQIPPSGGSEEYLRAWTAIESGTDIIASCLNGHYRPVVYSETDRLLALDKAFTNDKSPNSIRTIIEKRISTLAQNFQIPPGNSSVANDTISVSLRDLHNFILNPAESTLRWNLSLYEENDDVDSLIENEPFYSSPRSYNKIITDILHHYIQRHGDIDIRSFIESYYRYLRFMSMTPDGAFAGIDLDNIHNSVIERINSENGLSSFLAQRHERTVIHDITLGSSFPPRGAGLSLPPTVIQFDRGPNGTRVEIHGSLAHLWLNKDSGLAESLVITNSKGASPSNVIQSFLFFIAAASGLNPELSRAIGPGPYIIHVASKAGIDSFLYQDLDSSACTDFFVRLLTDFLASDDFDLLPLSIITNKRIIQPPQMAPCPSINEQKNYRETLAALIIEDSDKAIPAFRPMKILDLLDLQVPPDAYHKARDRLAMLLKPFSRGSTL